MAKTKRRLTVIKPFTPFERNKSKDIRAMITIEKINPTSVESMGIGGISRYTIEDICNYIELSGKPFSAVSSAIGRKRKGDTYERQSVC